MLGKVEICTDALMSCSCGKVPEKSLPGMINLMCFNLQVLHLYGNSGLTFKESSPVYFQMIPFLTIFTTAMLKYQGKVSYMVEGGEQGHANLPIHDFFLQIRQSANTFVQI